MTDRGTSEVTRETGTGTDLLHVVAAPAVWALHFLFCYIYAAVFCEKVGRNSPLDNPTIAVVVATVVALMLIGSSTLSLWRVRGRSLTDNDFDFEHNTPEERHRFLSHVALMLCVLSAVAVLYVAIPMLYLETCR